MAVQLLDWMAPVSGTLNSMDTGLHGEGPWCGPVSPWLAGATKQRVKYCEPLSPWLADATKQHV